MTNNKDFCIDRVFDELFHVCRSITGEGIRRSLGILQKYLPLTIKSVPTGTRVFDWEVPPEWKLNRAVLEGPDGEIVLDTHISNLHVLNFSEPFNGTVRLEELQDHLYSMPELPNAIPYVTSYYKRRWGFCISEEQRKTLKDGNYKVTIDTEIKDGHLNYATCDLVGERDETILLSTYLCHPSLGNNELSGPLALLLLYEKLRRLDRRRYSYKFLIIPETIGSITFLATEGKDLSKSLRGGIVLTCLGGPKRKVSFKLSRLDWTGRPSLIDKFARDIAERDTELFETREFSPASGSDERQFCSPGINWPMIQAAKTVYGEYKEYHTSLDNKEFMSVEAVEASAESLFVFLRIFELCDKKIHSKIEGGEPQLGKRGLYPTTNGPMTNKFSTDRRKDGRYQLNLLLNVLSLSDGSMTAPDIVKKLGVSFTDLLPIIEQLSANELIEIR